MEHTVITNGFLNIISWGREADARFELKDQADIWRVNTANYKISTNSTTQILDAAELAKSERFHFGKDRVSYAASHVALRELMGKYLGCHPAAVLFSTGINGKPCLRQPALLQFNMSHSGDYTLLCFAESPVGIDIERVKQAFDYQPVLEGNFSSGETANIMESGNTETFYKLWTRKEALSKLTGTGLCQDLKLLPVNDGCYKVDKTVIDSGAAVNMKSFNAAAGYYGTIACNSDITRLNFYEYVVH